MKATKFFILILFFEFIFINLNAQISGGNTVSSFVCSNRKVYAWGKNSTTLGTGLLGTGGTAATYSSPQVVTFPGGVDINQVNSGSGTHFLALDCYNNAWAWGNNNMGQVGNGAAAGIDGFVSSPTRVLALPEITATNKDASNQLTNVSAVYAGGNVSFAILQSGELVSWGSNGKGSASPYDDTYGQLGNGILPASGITSTQTAAGYVKVPGGGKLSGVIQVFASDNAAYALCDPDGDGVGTVYSWGCGLNGILGRDASGTSNPSSGSTVQDPWARPVRYVDGTIMNNITQIQAGDVFAAALDVNGYVWAWGNGGWNNATGGNTNLTSSAPMRVLKGTTTGNSNDGTYLLAKMIGAGQGFGMAVTIDNKPVAWGGGGYNDGGGFSGGSSTGTEYITYTGTTFHNDVIAIFRGDTYGFYQRADGSMWAWGNNQFGQLGIGGATSNEVLLATKMNPPTGCGYKDPEPYVQVSPKNITVCSSSFTGQVLNSGFLIGTTLANSYSIEWAKDGAVVSTGTVAVKGATYTATSPGIYTVTIKYIGSNSGCNQHLPATGIITISTYPASFSPPTNLTFCSDSADVKVTSTVSTNAKYNWYHTASSTTVIGSSIGTYSVRVPIVGATPTTGPDKILFVEESSYASGTILKKSEGCAATWFTGDMNLSTGAIDIDNSFATGYTVYEPVTISEVSFMYRSSIYSVGTSGTAAITFSIYGSKIQNGALVADDTKILGTLVANYTRTRGATEAMDLDVQLTAKGNVTLQSGTYFIGPSNYANTGSLAMPRLGIGNCALPTGIVDDVNGTIIKQNIGVCGYGNPSQASTGFVFDVKFNTAQHFCDRVPVTIKEVCLCATMNNVVISSTDADLTVCPGGSAVLTSNAQMNTTNCDFTWYKGDNVTGTIVFGPIANIASTSYTVTDANPGTYTLLVRDRSQPDLEYCYKKASVTINSAPAPTATISGGGTFEVGQVTTPVVIAFTGTAPFSVNYNPNAVVKTGIMTSPYQIPNPTAAGIFEYEVTGLSDKYCYGIVPTNKVTLELTPLIPVLISSISLPTTLDVYVGNTATLSPVISPVNATNLNVSWTTSNPSVATVNPNGVVTAVSVGNAVITATANDASGKSASCTVTVLQTAVVPVSAITVTPTVVNLAIGQTATAVATVSPTNATNKSVTWTSSNTAVASVNASGVILTLSEGTAVITVASVDNPSKTATVNVIVTDIQVTSVTVTSTTVNMNVEGTSVLTAVVLPSNAPQSIIWTSSNTAIATVNAAGVVTGISVGTTTIKATSSSNASIFGTVTVNVSANLVTSITMTPTTSTMHVGDVLTLTATVAPVNATDKTVTWTSSNSACATVNTSGVLTAVSIGTTTITATANDGSGKTGTCVVTVEAIPVISISLDQTTLNLTMASAPVQLVPTIVPVNATNKAVTWASSNPACATVNASGVVTPLSIGTCTITVTTVDGAIIASCVVTVSPTIFTFVSSINVNPTTLNLLVGSTSTITATVLPTNASNPSITWYTSNPTIATVNANGIVIALSPGTVQIKALSNDGSFIESICVVTVSPLLVKTITLAPTQANLEVSETLALQTVVTPSGQNDIITYTSSNPLVATVNPNGLVTAVGAGTAIITAKPVGATITATSIITVTQPITEISIVPQNATLDIQAVIGLTAVVFPVTATNKNIYWTSSNPSIATVSQTGLVTAIAEGTVTISANSADGSGKVGTSVITVNPAPVVCNQIQVFSNITNVYCSGAKTGEIELLVSGGVEPYTYKWSNTGTENTILGLQAGTYSVTITDDEGCSVVKVYEVTQPNALELTPTIVSPQCGNSDGSISVQISGGTSPYTFTWSDASITNAITAKEAGLYTVTATDNKGCEIEETYELSNDGAPEITVESVVPTNCNASTGGIYISVTGGTEPYSYAWNDSNTDEDRIDVSPGIYNVTVTDDNGCKSIASAEVESSSIVEPTIALVTVSVDNGKNQIVWQKETTDLIDFYTIYRENNVAGQYDVIGTVPYIETSIFEDPTANSQVRAWRYKISATDVCGNESELSTEHKTLHLQKNIGLGNVVNLDWTGYEGIYYATYNIYRINTSDVVELIDQVPSSISNYTDLTPPANVKSYYVAIVLPNEIDADQSLLKLESGPFTLALSNIAEVETGIADVENGVKVYPTLTTTIVNIEVNSIKHVKVSLLSSSGEVLFTKKMKDTILQIPVKQYSKGTYILYIEFDNEVIQKQIIIE